MYIWRWVVYDCWGNRVLDIHGGVSVQCDGGIALKHVPARTTVQYQVVNISIGWWIHRSKARPKQESLGLSHYTSCTYLAVLRYCTKPVWWREELENI